MKFTSKISLIWKIKVIIKFILNPPHNIHFKMPVSFGEGFITYNNNMQNSVKWQKEIIKIFFINPINRVS